VQRLEQSVMELHQMFIDFALLTEQQGELLDQVLCCVVVMWWMIDDDDEDNLKNNLGLSLTLISLTHS
jgi:hypothetical protein